MPPVSEHTNELMRQAIKAVEAVLPGCGIALVVFTDPAPGVTGSTANYIGNRPRPEMLVAMKEVTARWEGRGHASHSTKQ